jgi:ribosomal protein S18 acetylase RimI-like enzyme
MDGGKSTNQRVEIRPLQPDQWALHKSLRLAALADAPYAFTTQLADVVARPDEEWADLTRRRAGDPNGVTYFAIIEEEPCGMAACVLSEMGAEMLSVWVAPGCRRSGVGQALVDYAQDWASRRNADTLVVGVYADNLDAIAFYQRVGFQLTGVERFASRTVHRPILVLLISLPSNDLSPDQQPCGGES